MSRDRLRTPLFLEREGYRRRRRADAARLLPVLGVFLLMLPLFPGRGAFGTAAALVWLFGAWAVLIALAFMLGRRMRRAPQGEGEEAAP